MSVLIKNPVCYTLNLINQNNLNDYNDHNTVYNLTGLLCTIKTKDTTSQWLCNKWLF